MNSNDGPLCSGKDLLVYDLLKSLDTLIFVEIAVLYLFDNFSILLIIRTASQVLYQVKPPPFRNQPQLPPILVANFISIVTHILHDKPEAHGRASRGYLHGGLIIDFVGEHGPVSKWRLLGMDILLLGLQVLMLVCGHASNQSGETPKREQQQDLEAEEEGRRNTPVIVEGEEGIELQNLLPTTSQIDERSATIDESMTDGIILEASIPASLRGLLRRDQSTDTGSNATSSDAPFATLLQQIAAARATTQR